MTARENSNCFAILIDSLDVENRIKLGLIVNGFKNSVEKWSVFDRDVCGWSAADNREQLSNSFTWQFRLNFFA